jgi:hypothetical protein
MQGSAEFVITIDDDARVEVGGAAGKKDNKSESPATPGVPASDTDEKAKASQKATTRQS